MIKIDTSKIDSSKYYKYIENYINQKDTKYSLENINYDLLMIFDKDLEQIVTAKPNEVRELIKIAPKDFTKDITQLKDLYEVFRNKWAVEFIEDLNIKVCPFCNREYIFKFEDKIKGEPRIIASLDHYYDKNTYPFLSVSIFNFIPCCHICNSKFKHTKNFYNRKHLHPYEDSFNGKAKFTKFFNNVNYENKKFDLLSKERISLTLKPLDTNDIATQNTINTFRLETLYQEHKDIVLELIQKAQVYNESYIDELFQKYEGTLFKNREDVLRHITGGYIEDKDINKRPLSKLIKDISEELDLI
ncbi:hypothetical protein [Arcobacter sp. F2176]|uniref:hypothetical protein n=1 Tax=Arcobacter sp. F2176 TaxID=2044511 RepID=UPI00100B6AA6|nr:hypothetical protein [Arcobacter sp. F2176]RXJ82230.1 hypothetical protein CRU95_01880 [Arcobacter sp. F2176]